MCQGLWSQPSPDIVFHQYVKGAGLTTNNVSVVFSGDQPVCFHICSAFNGVQKGCHDLKFGSDVQFTRGQYPEPLVAPECP